MSKTLKIAVWNANGLSQHRHEVEAFLINKDIDIMLISETHFTKKSFIKINNYTIYHTLHPENKAHGGTCVIIRSKIKHHETDKFQQEHIQATSIVVEDWLGSFNITAIYCPPKYANKESHYSHFFSTLGNRFFVGGDYNAKHPFWGSRLTSPKGRELFKTLTNMKMDALSTGEPTYWPSDRRKTPDCIDFCVLKGMSKNYFSIESCFELSSDHSPLISIMHNQVVVKESPPVLCSNKTDWELFRNYVNSHLNFNIPLNSEENICDAIEQFNLCVQQAAWQATPQSKRKERTDYCSPAVLEMIALKRKIRKQWQITRSPELKGKLNKAVKKIRNVLKNDKESAMKNYLEKLSPSEAGEYSLWKATKSLKQPKIAVPPIRRSDQSWAKTNTEKAELFAQHLEAVFTPNPRQISIEEEDEMHVFLDETHQLDLPIKSFTKSEVSAVIMKDLSSKKAPGYDLITGKILKELPANGFKFLTQVFNSILRTSHFPAQWKVAQIIMILKPGKVPEDVKSYRPISLLPLTSKVFEKLFYKKLIQIVENRRLIPDYQFGFRQHHSTIEQVHRLVDEVQKNMENRKFSSVAFLDITQAFDKVWHTGLLYKLKKSLPINYYSIIKSYIQDRLFQVKFNDVITGLHKLQSGVPQGSILGPLLYLLFTRDLPVTPEAFVATFADDTAILTSDEQSDTASITLQENLNAIESWLKKWRINVNGSKCVHVTFTTRKGNCSPVYLNNQQIPVADEVKYLGIHLDRRLTWRKHIFTKRKQLGIKLRNMYWLIGRSSSLSKELKLLLYKTILKPVWTYGIQLWGTAANSNIEILQRFQSKMLRIIIDAPWFMTNEAIHNDLRIPTVKEEIQDYSRRYQQKIEAHPNALVGHLMELRQGRRLKMKISSDLVL